jgi:hypothetical protein
VSKFIRIEPDHFKDHFSDISKQNGGDIEPVIVEDELVAVRIGKYRISATHKAGLTLHADVGL